MTKAEKAKATREANKQKLATILLLGGVKGDTLNAPETIKEEFLKPFGAALSSEECTLEEEEVNALAKEEVRIGNEVIGQAIKCGTDGIKSTTRKWAKGVCVNKKAGGAKTEEQLLESAKKAAKALTGDSKRKLLADLVAELGGTYVA